MKLAFFEKRFVLRDYRITKASLKRITDLLVPNYEYTLQHNPDDKKAKANLKYLREVEIPYLDMHLQELVDKMTRLGMKLE